MRKLICYLKDVLYALSALAKAFERIAECLEYFVEQNKNTIEKRDKALDKLTSLLSTPPPTHSYTFDRSSSPFRSFFDDMRRES